MGTRRLTALFFGLLFCFALVHRCMVCWPRRSCSFFLFLSGTVTETSQRFSRRPGLRTTRGRLVIATSWAFTRSSSASVRRFLTFCSRVVRAAAGVLTSGCCTFLLRYVLTSACFLFSAGNHGLALGASASRLLTSSWRAAPVAADVLTSECCVFSGRCGQATIRTRCRVSRSSGAPPCGRRPVRWAPT